ncbi:hypothetical protein BHM03_00029823 [Ensete ventricosum]|nr:hypothetical protein BHM03_00029823 [Ensete ventricosum]
MWIRFVRFSTALSFLATAAALIRVSLRVRRGRSYRKQSDGDARGDGALQSTVLGRSRVYWFDLAAQWQVVRYAVGASGSFTRLVSRNWLRGWRNLRRKQVLILSMRMQLLRRYWVFTFLAVRMNVWCSNKQVRRLAMEIRQLASARPITVLNGNSGSGALSVVVILSAF